MKDPNKSFSVCCPTGNTMTESEESILKDPCDYVESEKDSEEYEPEE